MMWPFRSDTVLGEARRRGISLLLHSTHLYVNLPHLLTGKTLHTARSLMEVLGRERALRFLHDPNRYERFAVGLDYVNGSLTFPNVELLYRRSKADWKAEWVHLVLDLRLLDDSRTRFCPVSAASEFGKHIGHGVAGFRAMFAEEVQGHRRDRLPRSVPTHPQAEVLIRGPLPLESVQRIIVPTVEIAREVERLGEQSGVAVPVEVRQPLFVWPEWLLPAKPQ